MSSYLSEKSEFLKVQSSYDLALIDNVISVKNTYFDANVKLGQDAIDEFAKIDVISEDGSREKYVRDKVQGLTDYLNTSGNVNFERGNVQQQIRQQTSQILDNKILTDISNTAKYRTFQKEVAKAKDGKNGEYNQSNELDAREVSGFEEWFKDGSSKGYGSLQYTNYKDVKQEKSKLTSEYVAKFLLQPQYLGTDETKPDFYKDSYGNNVDIKTVEKYVDSQLGTDDINQLKIDARQSLGKMVDADYNKYAGTYYTNKNLEDGLKLAETEAYLRNNPDKKEEYKASLEVMKIQISNNKKKIASGVFNKSEIYDIYKDVVVKEVAAPFEIHTITKIDRDKLPFEIMNADRNYALDLKKLKVAEDANVIAKGIANGTSTTIPTNGEDKKTTDFEDIQKATYHTSTALDTYLKVQNIDGYKDKTPQEQWSYMSNLKATDSKVAGNNATLLNLTKDFQFAQKGYANIVNGKNEDFKKVVNEKYNDMIGGNINTNNLASTAPLTASLVRSGRKYETLSESEKAGLSAEFASQMIQFGEVDRDEKEFYKKVIIKNKLQLKSSPDILKSISTPTEESKGFFGSIWDATKGVVGTALDLGQGIIHDNIVYPYQSVVQGRAYADQKDEIYNKEEGKDWENNLKNLKTIPQTALKYSPQTWIPYKINDVFLNQDSNITEIQSGDLNTKNGVKTDVGQSFRDFNNRLNKDIKDQAKGYQENLKSNQAFTFSTASKVQNITAIAIEIENAIAASKNEKGDDYPIPANDNNYTIYREGDRFKVKYKTGTGEKQTYAEAYLQNLPDSVIQKYDLTKQDWINSPLNSKVELDPVTIHTYTDANKRSQDVEIMYKNGVLDSNMQNVLYQNPSSTPFATNDELAEKIKTEKGDDFYEKNKVNIDKILNDDYKAIPFINPSTGTFQFRINYSGTKNSPSVDLGTIKNEHQWDLIYRAESLKLKLDQIYKLK